MRIAVKYHLGNKKYVSMLQINTKCELSKDEIEEFIRAAHPTFYDYKILS